MSFVCPLMKRNEGTLDRILRIGVGFMALSLGFAFFTGIAQIIAYAVAIVALATGTVGFCGLYAILGISTRHSKQENK